MFKKYQLRSYNIRLVIVLVVTSVFGIAVINSADPTKTLKQCMGLALSLFVMFVVSFINYNWLLRFYWLVYVFNIILLLLVRFSGDESNGAKRWLDIKGFRFQPSELTKIILIMFTAKLISLYKEQLNTWKFLVVIGVLLLIPMALVVTQPDLSTTILIALTLFTIIFCAGLSYRIIGIALLCIVPVVVGLAVYISNPDQKLLEDYQRNRIMAFIEPENYSDGTYQQDYSVQAIGSGRLTGKGLNNDDPSSLKNANYIAEGHTDFIFAVLGEELGFVGCCMAILLLSWIVIECIIAAIRAKDFVGRLICCGVAAYIAFQSTINICVVTQLMPNTGLPLPFFSYGLTSLVTLYISMGVVLNISLQRTVERDDEIFAEDFRG
ncbi:MAG: rod shape-determining protein RodA [Lachnospira sp.]|nr:rod shape-determining protein RodA [Lachnospira sp.]